MEPIEKTVMVVEDHRLYQELIRAILNGGGFDTMVVETLQAAKNLCGLPFAAITLDLGLADARGFQAVKELRPLFPDIPLVVITGTIGEQDIFELLRCGADSCIRKPFHNGDVLQHVQRAIQMRSEFGRYTQLGRITQALDSHTKRP